MKNHTNIGRIVGTGMLTSFVVGMLSNFKLQADLFEDGGLMVNAAAHTDKISMITLLGLTTGLISTMIAALVLSSFRHRAPVLATTYFALVVVGLAISVLEYSSLFAFSSLSKAYLAAGMENSASFNAAKAVLFGLRDGIHYPDKLISGTGFLILFAFFYKLRLVPRPIALFSMFTVPLQLFAVGRAMFGHDVIYVMIAPVSLAVLTVITWLLIKGFADENIKDVSRLAASTGSG